MYLRFVKNTYFQTVKFGNSCIGFFQTRKITIYKMISVRKSYTFQSLLKNTILLPAEKFGNINLSAYYQLYQQTVLLKIIYDFRIEISFMEKQKQKKKKKLHSDYVFLTAIIYSCETVWVNVLVSKGWLQSEITVQTL